MDGIDENIGCVVIGCGRISDSRGRCTRHYVRLARRIRNGQLTWAEAEMWGLCLPPGDHKRRWGGEKRPRVATTKAGDQA